MIAHFTIARIAIPIGVAGLAAVGAARPTGHAPVAKPPRTLAHWALAALALVLIIALAAVCYNHVRFPGYIETMEGVVLQHVQQIVHRQPVYPAVTPAYVPLAYTPGFYYLSAPFVGLFGPSVALLRIIAILGLIVSALVIWMAVRRLTGSAWWALMAVGFFAAAYRVMDSALDNAHADSWLLATALAGTEIIDRATTRRGRLFGMLLLVLAFWFKQHGALFAFGGVLYLTWKFGVRRALPYWTLAILGGGVLYLAAVRWPFGPAFHYFTWAVPSGWSTLQIGTLTRIAILTVTAYPVLIIAAIGECAWAESSALTRVNAWHMQFAVGVCSAVMGGLDWGCSDNVYIPFGGFTIVLGSLGLWRFFESDASRVSRRVAQIGAPVFVAISLAVLMFDPRDEMLPIAQARVAYADLLHTINALHAPVYFPSMGYIEGEHELSPQVVWVATADMIRGTHRSAADTARAWSALGPAAHPLQDSAFILTNTPLAKVPGPTARLATCYTLAQDFGDRFSVLHGPVKHFFPDWPRYLYRYDPATPCED